MFRTNYSIVDIVSAVQGEGEMADLHIFRRARDISYLGHPLVRCRARTVNINDLGSPFLPVPRYTATIFDLIYLHRTGLLREKLSQTTAEV